MLVAGGSPHEQCRACGATTASRSPAPRHEMAQGPWPEPGVTDQAEKRGR